jgi:hypothetical protein
MPEAPTSTHDEAVSADERHTIARLHDRIDQLLAALAASERAVVQLVRERDQALRAAAGR